LPKKSVPDSIKLLNPGEQDGNRKNRLEWPLQKTNDEDNNPFVATFEPSFGGRSEYANVRASEASHSHPSVANDEEPTSSRLGDMGVALARKQLALAEVTAAREHLKALEAAFAAYVLLFSIVQADAQDQTQSGQKLDS
jgi:hypothetical protein